MKKNDVKIGTEYAYNHAQEVDRYGRPERVKVLAGPISREKTSYSWSRGTRKTSVFQVERVDSDREDKVFETEARWLHEEWAPYAARKAEQARQRRAADNAAREARRDRALTLLDLIPALRHAGLPDREHKIYTRSEDFIVALTDAGLYEDLLVKQEESTRGTFWGVEYILTAPLADGLEKYVTRGEHFTVSYDDLVTLTR